MKFILGTKQNMIQYFAEDGKAYAATVALVEPVVVTHVKTTENDGYDAIQLAGGKRKEKNINKPQLGAWKDLGNFAFVKEFRVEGAASAQKGDIIKAADVLSAGQMITVTGISKGKGFQGVVKRHGFGGGRRSHGQKHSEREAGSIGGGGRAGGRVAKGMRMPGRMGSDRTSVKNLQILAVDPETNMVFIRGAVPGKRGTVLEIVTQ